MSPCPQQVTFLVPSRESTPFEPKELTPDGHVNLLEFCLFLCQEVHLLLQSTHPYSDPHSVILACPNSHSFNHSFLHSSYLAFPTQLADLCIHCSQYFSKGVDAKPEDRFLSETSEAYAFGSNSSGQLAMGTQEKVLKATHMPHMANCQVVS